MDVLFHFSLYLICGMAVNARLDHEPWKVMAVAAVATMIDLDHVLFAYPRAFHTVFVLFGAPLALLYLGGRLQDRFEAQTLSILLFVMLFSHILADLFYDSALKPLYPVSDLSVTAPQVSLSLVRDGWLVVSPEGFLLAVTAAMVSTAYFSEEFIYLVEKQHENARQAAKKALS